MKNIIILWALLLTGCSNIVVNVQCEYNLTDVQKEWIVKIYGVETLNNIEDIIYYSDLPDGVSGQYKSDANIILIDPVDGTFNVVLHEIMHYYQKNVLHQSYDGVQWYGLNMSDIGKEKLGTEQEARAIEWIYLYYSDSDWYFSDEDIKVINYLVPYMKDRNLLGGL